MRPQVREPKSVGFVLHRHTSCCCNGPACSSQLAAIADGAARSTASQPNKHWEPSGPRRRVHDEARGEGRSTTLLMGRTAVLQQVEDLVHERSAARQTARRRIDEAQNKFHHEFTGRLAPCHHSRLRTITMLYLTLRQTASTLWGC